MGTICSTEVPVVRFVPPERRVHNARTRQTLPPSPQVVGRAPPPPPADPVSPTSGQPHPLPPQQDLNLLLPSPTSAPAPPPSPGSALAANPLQPPQSITNDNTGSSSVRRPSPQSATEDVAESPLPVPPFALLVRRRYSGNAVANSAAENRGAHGAAGYRRSTFPMGAAPLPGVGEGSGETTLATEVEETEEESDSTERRSSRSGGRGSAIPPRPPRVPSISSESSSQLYGVEFGVMGEFYSVVPRRTNSSSINTGSTRRDGAWGSEESFDTRGTSFTTSSSHQGGERPPPFVRRPADELPAVSSRGSSVVSSGQLALSSGSSDLAGSTQLQQQQLQLLREAQERVTRAEIGDLAFAGETKPSPIPPPPPPPPPSLALGTSSLQQAPRQGALVLPQPPPLPSRTSFPLRRVGTHVFPRSAEVGAGDEPMLVSLQSESSRGSDLPEEAASSATVLPAVLQTSSEGCVGTPNTAEGSRQRTSATAVFHPLDSEDGSPLLRQTSMSQHEGVS